MAPPVVCSNAMVLLLFIYCLLLLPLFSVRSLFCFAVRCVFSCFIIISLGKREVVVLLLLGSECHVTVIVLWFFLTVPQLVCTV